MSNMDGQRTYALVGTGGCGKTSLAEMLLFNSAAIGRMGNIEEGTTALDYEPEEIKRRGSIQPGFATFQWNKSRHFLIDAPGDANFSGDLPLLLTGADGVVFVVDAVDGVRPQTRKIWKEVRSEHLPTIVFVTKMDRERADFDTACSGLASVLGMKNVILTMPILEKDQFTGYIDILEGKAYRFTEGGTEEMPIPADLLDEFSVLRDTTIENIAESDDALMEAYLETGELDADSLQKGLRAGVLACTLIPVVVGASALNRGGAQLLNAISRWFPSPLEVKDRYHDATGNVCAVAENGSACGVIFKTIADPFAGQLNIMRVISGTIGTDSTLKNMRSGEMERTGTLLYLVGKNQIPCKDPLGPGVIVAVGKLKNTKTGDTLCDDKKNVVLQMPTLPPQLIMFALAPREKGDEDKVYAAVQKLLDEDITLRLDRDEETGDILLYGMGQMHIETAVEKARRRYKADIVLKTPRVPYRETIRGKVQVQGRHKKQSGGRGQFGDCWIEMEPMPRGGGYVFEDAIVGGAIPRNYIPAIDKGIQESAARGFLAGYPVVDFKVRLYDGSYHTVDSSEMAFKIAGSLAFKKAMESLKAVLLEPIVLLSVSVPDEYMGDVIGDLSSRRGKVLGSDSQAGITEIRAHVPMSEVLRYAPDLRSFTGGQGVFTMDFDHYEEAPQPVVEKVVAEHNKQKQHD
ncbi:MAG: elongation factor G [Desulfovibrionaceae bacterium]|nr:elongation factor G [Desulfovibrionaceae bacterium]